MVRKQVSRSRRTRRSARRRTKTLRGGSRGKDKGTNYKKIAVLAGVGTAAAVLGGLALRTSRAPPPPTPSTKRLRPLPPPEKRLTDIEARELITSVVHQLTTLDPSHELVNRVDKTLYNVKYNYILKQTWTEDTHDINRDFYYASRYVIIFRRDFKPLTVTISRSNATLQRFTKELNTAEAAVTIDETRTNGFNTFDIQFYEQSGKDTVRRYVVTRNPKIVALKTAVSALLNALKTAKNCSKDNLKRALISLVNADVKFYPYHGWWDTPLQADVKARQIADDLVTVQRIQNIDDTMKNVKLCDGFNTTLTEQVESIRRILNERKQDVETINSDDTIAFKKFETFCKYVDTVVFKRALDEQLVQKDADSLRKTLTENPCDNEKAKEKFLLYSSD